MSIQIGDKFDVSKGEGEFGPLYHLNQNEATIATCEDKDDAEMLKKLCEEEQARLYVRSIS